MSERPAWESMDGYWPRSGRGTLLEVFDLGQFVHRDPSDLRQLVLERCELGTAGHVVGEILQAHLTARGAQLQGAEPQYREVVADHVGVVRVVGDEDDAQA